MGFFFRAYMTREQVQAAKDYVEDLERRLAEAQDKREARLDRADRTLDELEKATTQLVEARKVIAALRTSFDAAPGEIDRLKRAMERARYMLGPHPGNVAYVRAILETALGIEPFNPSAKST